MSDALIKNVLMRNSGVHKYYFGSIDASMLKNLTYVPLDQENPKPCPYLHEKKGGYQRWGSLTRMKLFRDYLKSQPTAFIPPLLISARKWVFKPTNEVIGQLEVHGSAAIIDGQHRAGGFIAHYEEDNIDRPVDVLVYINLSEEDEKKLFLDVNSTQVGIAKGLKVYLEGGEASRIATALDEDQDSPFYHRISKQTLRKNQLFKLHSFAGGIEKTFAHGKLENLDEDGRVAAMKRYWGIIADVYADQWGSDIEILDDPRGGRSKITYKLLELTGYLAWSYLGPQILGDFYTSGHGFNWLAIEDRIGACSGIDWRKDGQYEGRTGSAGASVIKLDLERLLPSVTSIELESEE
jgi:DNA sulfur modification protein DndB